MTESNDDGEETSDSVAWCDAASKAPSPWWDGGKLVGIGREPSENPGKSPDGKRVALRNVGIEIRSRWRHLIEVICGAWKGLGFCAFACVYLHARSVGECNSIGMN